jgi:hypothetical protein
MKPPIVYDETNPNTQSTIKTTAIVYNIFDPPFCLCTHCMGKVKKGQLYLGIILGLETKLALRGSNTCFLGEVD